MEDITPFRIFTSILINKEPSAFAWIKSSLSALSGIATFYNTPLSGIIVCVEVHGLPDNGSSDFYGMHIHEFGNCTPPFDKTGTHYNPTKTMHPHHAGDMPPLLSNNGYAWTAFYDKRISINEIIGKSIIIHQMPDDFHTQPSGDSGTKIACGVIKKNFK